MKNPLNLKVTLSFLFLILFTFCNDDDPLQFNLRTQASPSEGGSVSPVSGTFDEGEEITLRATPSEEYLFTNWSDDGAGNENPMTVVMTKDMFVTANFEKRTYPLSIEIHGEGTVKEEIVAAKSSTDYPSGTIVQLTAVPEAEWEFIGWEGDHVGTENPLVVTVKEPMNLTAVFQKVNYALTIEIFGQGTVKEEIIAAKYSTDYPSGTTVKLTAVPDEEWSFLKWTGAYAGNENPIELTITEALELSAYFEPENLEKTYVPDTQFEKALIDLGYDDFVDDYVLTSNIREIEILDISDRKIVDLTGIENFESLNILDAGNNSILSADFSDNHNLGSLNLENNDLGRLDLSLMNCLLYVNVKANPITCLQVNEEQLECMQLGEIYMKVETDEGVEISLDCGFGNEELTYVPDDNFEQALIDLGFDDKRDDYVLTANISLVEELDLSGLGIHGLTGIEGFTALKSLNCSNNLIKSLDLSRNTNLGELIAEYNEIKTINLTQSDDLTIMRLKGNALSGIDLSNTGSLFWLDVSENVLESLDISNMWLFTLYANNNLLTCIKVNENQLNFLPDFLTCSSGAYNCWVADPDVEFALDCEP